MRNEEQGLRTCPTCRREVTPGELGLRDFRWLKDALPARVGPSDLDFFLEQSRTERGLFFEFKPIGSRLNMGQRLIGKRLVKADFDFWVVWEEDPDTVSVGPMNKDGQLPVVERMPVSKLKHLTQQWWEAGYG